MAGFGPDGPIGVYLAAGMVAAVNPCGFAMLPAYLGFFLGLDAQDNTSVPVRLGRAARVALTVTAGFLCVFVVAGLAVEITSFPVYETMPWVSMVVGLALLVLGFAMVFGFEPIVRLPKLERGGRERTLRSMFVFGLSYAVASIGCTLPTFLVAVTGTMNRESVVDGLAVFGLYTLGMGLVLTVLTVAIALAQTSIVTFFRNSRALVGRASGVLLILAGAYVAYYGTVELRSQRDPGSVGGGGVVDTVSGWSYDIERWVEEIGPVTLALSLALTLVVVTLVTVALRGRHRTTPGTQHSTQRTSQT